MNSTTPPSSHLMKSIMLTNRTLLQILLPYSRDIRHNVTKGSSWNQNWKSHSFTCRCVHSRNSMVCNRDPTKLAKFCKLKIHYKIENTCTWVCTDMGFLFECWTWYLTHSLCSFMRYHIEHVRQSFPNIPKHFQRLPKNSSTDSNCGVMLQRIKDFWYKLVEISVSSYLMKKLVEFTLTSLKLELTAGEGWVGSKL